MQLGCSLHNLQEWPPGLELGSGLLDTLFKTGLLTELHYTPPHFI